MNLQSKILEEKYFIINPIYEDTSDNVYLALDKINTNRVIIKVLEINNNFKPVSLNQFFSINNKYISSFIEYFIDTEQNNLFLVCDFVEGKIIDDYILEGGHFNEYEVINIAIKLSETLEYLHSFSPVFLYNNINPKNIITNIDGDVRLLNPVMFIQGNDQPNKDLKTILEADAYKPAEFFTGKLDKSSDIYSLGLTLVYLLSHKNPLSFEVKYHKTKPFFKRKSENIDFSPFVNISSILLLIIEQMIKIDQKKRYKNFGLILFQLNYLKSNQCSLILKNKNSYTPGLETISCNSVIIENKQKKIISYLYIVFLFLIYFILTTFASPSPEMILLPFGYSLAFLLRNVDKRFKKNNFIIKLYEKKLTIFQNDNILFRINNEELLDAKLTISKNYFTKLNDLVIKSNYGKTIIRGINDINISKIIGYLNKK